MSLRAIYEYIEVHNDTPEILVWTACRAADHSKAHRGLAKTEIGHARQYGMTGSLSYRRSAGALDKVVVTTEIAG